MFGIDVLPTQLGDYGGLQVLGFRSESQARQAGLELGDVIVSIGGVQVGAPASLVPAQPRSRVGQPVEMQIIRGGQFYRVQVPVIGVVDEQEPGSPLSQDTGLTQDTQDMRSNRTAEAGDSLAESQQLDSRSSRALSKPPVDSASGPTLARPRSSLGVDARDAKPKRGVEVVVVRERTAGAIGGLKPGDRIVSLEGRLVLDLNGLIRELAMSQPGDEVPFGIVRGDSMLELTVEMGGPGGMPFRAATETRSAETGSAETGSAETGSAEKSTEAKLSSPGPKTNPESKTKKSVADGGSSFLGGMGAALGGFFQGSQAKNTNSKSAGADESSAIDNGRITGEFADPAQSEGIRSSDRTAEPLSEDPLALPDDSAMSRSGDVPQ
jgi:membrane-associated protease RseP (regulator of RpoE activity)